MLHAQGRAENIDVEHTSQIARIYVGDQRLETMIWRVVSRAAELGNAPLTLPSRVVYATFDGLFQYALLRHLAGDIRAVEEMLINIGDFLLACGTPAKRRVRPVAVDRLTIRAAR
jgi:hypothetical protein